jgi:excisionase family DNA binding protein
METIATESPYLTYEEAASYCRCNRVTLWRASRRGDLRASGPPNTRLVRFRVVDLDAWMGSRSRK